ncbi:hypothetical protein D3C72_1975600 [compost metagenome]
MVGHAAAGVRHIDQVRLDARIQDRRVGDIKCCATAHIQQRQDVNRFVVVVIHFLRAEARGIDVQRPVFPDDSGAVGGGHDIGIVRSGTAHAGLPRNMEFAVSVHGHE